MGPIPFLLDCVAKSSRHPFGALASLLLAFNLGTNPPATHIHRSHRRTVGAQSHALDRWNRLEHNIPRLRFPALEKHVPSKVIEHRKDPSMKAALETEQEQQYQLFGDLRLPGSIASALRAAGVSSPLPIQAVSSLTIKREKYTIIHSETGSGKTLAYLLPLLAGLHNSRPCQLLIVVPSRELAVQTAAVVQQMWPYHGSQRAFVLLGTQPLEAVEAMRKAACPVVVATPRALFSLVRHLAGSSKTHSTRVFKHTYSKDMEILIKNLRAIVLDEVDALLLDRTSAWASPIRSDATKFKEFTMPAARAVQGILKAHTVDQARREQRRSFTKAAPGRAKAPRGRAKQSNERNQLKVVACSASASNHLRQELSRLLDVQGGHINVITPADAASEEPDTVKRGVGERGLGAIAIPKSITHTWVPCKDEEDKLIAFSVVLSKAGARRALLFLPDDAPLRATVQRLREKGLNAQMLHEALSLGDGLVHVEAYESLRKSMASSISSNSSESIAETNSTHLLVTTLGSARGLDIPNMDCVALFSLPTHADDYLHVAGRTGRQGHTGAVFTFLREDESRLVGHITRKLGISMKPSAEIALALSDARDRDAR